MEPLTVDIIVTVLVGLAYTVGIAGIILPVLPGTITIAIATLIWAIVIGGITGWVVFAVVLVLSAVGMTASYVLTGQRLKRAGVPNWPILVGVGGAITGVILGFIGVPFLSLLGLPAGFLAGLYLAEYYRTKDPSTALTTSIVALKALGIGILIELTCAFFSLLVFGTGVFVHFAFHA